MPTCPDCGATVAPDDSRCAACGASLGDGGEATADAGAVPDATDAESELSGTTTDDLGARAAGTPPVADEEYMAPPGEWTPPEGKQPTARTRPAVEPLGAAATLRWAARAVAERPVAAAPFLVAGLAGAAAAAVAYGLALFPSVLAPRASPAAALLSVLALAAAVPGVAAAALLAEVTVTDGTEAVSVGDADGVAPDSSSGRALLTAAVPRLRDVAAATAAAAALTFVGYVFFVLPGAILGPKVSLAPHAAALDGTGPVESLERSWRRTRGRLRTVVGVWAAVAVVVVTAFAVAPVAGALLAPPVASVGAVALARVYLEGG